MSASIRRHHIEDLGRISEQVAELCALEARIRPSAGPGRNTQVNTQRREVSQHLETNVKTLVAQLDLNCEPDFHFHQRPISANGAKDLLRQLHRLLAIEVEMALGEAYQQGFHT